MPFKGRARSIYDLAEAQKARLVRLPDIPAGEVVKHGRTSSSTAAGHPRGQATTSANPSFPGSVKPANMTTATVMTMPWAHRGRATGRDETL